MIGCLSGFWVFATIDNGHFNRPDGLICLSHTYFLLSSISSEQIPRSNTVGGDINALWSWITLPTCFWTLSSGMYENASLQHPCQQWILYLGSSWCLIRHRSRILLNDFGVFFEIFFPWYFYYLLSFCIFLPIFVGAE